MKKGWQLLDRDNKGHIDGKDLWRVCLDMGFKVRIWRAQWRAHGRASGTR